MAQRGGEVDQVGDAALDAGEQRVGGGLRIGQRHVAAAGAARLPLHPGAEGIGDVGDAGRVREADLVAPIEAGAGAVEQAVGVEGEGVDAVGRVQRAPAGFAARQAQAGGPGAAEQPRLAAQRAEPGAVVAGGVGVLGAGRVRRRSCSRGRAAAPRSAAPRWPASRGGAVPRAARKPSRSPVLPRQARGAGVVALGGEAVAGDQVVEGARRCRRRRHSARRVRWLPPATSPKACDGAVGRRAAGDEVDDAAHGAGAVERGGGPAQHLDALHVDRAGRCRS